MQPASEAPEPQAAGTGEASALSRAGRPAAASTHEPTARSLPVHRIIGEPTPRGVTIHSRPPAGATPSHEGVTVRTPRQVRAMSAPADPSTVRTEMTPGVGRADQPTGPYAVLGDGGERIGSYALATELGRGGCATVWRAVHTGSGQEVALKVIAPRDSERQGNLELALGEAQAYAALKHPNLIACHGVGQDAGRIYLALELMTRGDARGLAQAAGGRLSERQVVALGIDCVRGLAAIHKAGLIHRDIKPANIFIADDGSAKLADFGLMQMIGDSSSAARRIGLTPAFMAPETAQDGIEVDARSDLYALGATLYYLAGGALPYHGDNLEMLISAVLHAPVPDVRAANPQVGEHLALVIRMAMAKDPAQRYAHAGRLLDDLLALVAGVPPPYATGRKDGTSRMKPGVQTMPQDGTSWYEPSRNAGSESGMLSIPGTRRQAVFTTSRQLAGRAPAGTVRTTATHVAQLPQTTVTSATAAPVALAATVGRGFGWPVLLALTVVAALAGGGGVALGLRQQPAAGVVAEVPRSGGLPDDGHVISWRGDVLAALRPVGGLTVDGPVLSCAAGGQLIANDAAALNRVLAQAGDFSVELVLRPGATSDGAQGRIVALARTAAARNFSIGQAGDRIEVRLRTTATTPNGLRPHLASAAGTLSGGRQHLTVVRQGGVHLLYLDGAEAGRASVPGDLTGWDEGAALVIAGDPGGEAPWTGELSHLAFFSRPLSPGEVAQRAKRWTVTASR